jgi:hypothetical protein
MHKVREGFESNSSSSHTLVIGDISVPLIKDLAQLGHVDEKGNFIIAGNTRFGWEWEIWDFPADKACYLRIDSDNEPWLIDRLREAIGENVGVEPQNVIFEGIDDEDPDTMYSYYIDHQSVGTSVEVLNGGKESIWNFIMNPESMVEGGNDNEDGPIGFGD